MTAASDTVLDVRDLRVTIPTPSGILQAVRGISFDVNTSPLIITPYMHNGSVLEYIRNVNNVRDMPSRRQISDL